MTKDKFDIVAELLFHIVRSKRKVSLDELAIASGKSISWIKQAFDSMVGVSPQRFQQFLTVEKAKQGLMNGDSTLAISFKEGLSGNARLHDAFMSIESITPGQYKSQGDGLEIIVEIFNTVYGQLLVGECKKGICYAEFLESSEDNIGRLKACWPKASISFNKLQQRDELIEYFRSGSNHRLKMFLKGSAFQVQVWRALLELSQGQLASYGVIAARIGKENASRAVGTAIGNNNIALLIPCHRVIRAAGHLGGYKWGVDRKAALLAVELAKRRAFY